MILEIPTARVFKPLLDPSRYKGAYGGRGSGKSHFFAEKLIDDCQYEKGLLCVCIREVQKTLKDSAYRLISTKLEKFGLGEREGFKVYNDRIKTPGDGVILFQGMQDHTAESIKSLEGFKRAFVEEAQTLSELSLKLLRPTIREEGSEIWFGWNPRRKNDPVDSMLRGGKPPTGAIIVRANWSDNPWFTGVLEQERKDCLDTNPDEYDHIWEGGYIAASKGAYYAQHIAKAKKEGRIGRVAQDPLFSVRLFCDIGGTGAKSDAFVIWAAQFIGKEICLIDYYEAVGQELGEHLAWMRRNGYEPGKAEIILPHDGGTNDKVFRVSYESAFRTAGYKVSVIPNQGKGAASNRIEAARKLFPQMWFDKVKCEAGLEALAWYHEKKDDIRQIGLGPEHDWSSHAADGFGEMCISYKTEKPRKKIKPRLNIA